MPRAISGPDAVSIVAGSMLGVGIFLSPAIVATQFATPVAFLAMWLLGGAVALCGAAAYAQLGTLVPRAGGDYVYLRAGFGPAVAAAGGWILVVAVFPGSLATMAVALGEYQLPVLMGALGYRAEAAIVGVPAPALFGIALVVALTAVNAAGAHLSARTQLFLTAVPVVLLAVLAVAALGLAPGGAVSPAPDASPAEFSDRFATATMAVYFAYSGWNAVGYVGGEVENPRRNIPVGLIGGTVLVTGLYMLLCAAFVAVLGLDGLQGAPEAGSALTAALFGADGERGMAAMIALAIVGSLNATVLGGGRVTFAMACDGALPPSLATLGERALTPVRALWLQCALSVALILTGTFEQLLSMTSLAMLLLGALTVGSLFVLKTRRGETRSSARFPWWAVMPAGYLVCAVFVIGTSLRGGIRGIAGGGRVEPDFVFGVLGLAVFVGVLLLYLLRGARRARVVGG